MPEPSVPLSAIEHWAYCNRQAGLILLENVWEDNGFTAKGAIAHRRIDRGDPGSRSGVREIRSLPVFSDALGIHGVCDLVEFHGHGVVPVEYKVGRYIAGGPADRQVAAQALCLESMFDKDIEAAFVYSVAERQRHRVELTDELRAAVKVDIAAIRAVMLSLRLPQAVNDDRCTRCSLNPSCLPAVLGRSRSIRSHARELFEVHQDGE